MLMAIKALLGDRKFYFAVDHDRGRSVRVKHIEAQNQHLLLSPLFVLSDHSFRLEFGLDICRAPAMSAAPSTETRFPVVSESSTRNVAKGEHTLPSNEIGG